MYNSYFVPYTSCKFSISPKLKFLNTPLWVCLQYIHSLGCHQALVSANQNPTLLLTCHCKGSAGQFFCSMPYGWSSLDCAPLVEGVHWRVPESYAHMSGALVVGYLERLTQRRLSPKVLTCGFLVSPA